MDYSLSDIFLATQTFICQSPWEVTLGQIKDDLEANGIEFNSNQDVSICITQMSTQKIFEHWGFEECPFRTAGKGLYRSQTCQLPELRERIQTRIENILHEQNGHSLTLQEIKELVPDQESLHPDLLGTNRIKDALDDLVNSGIVRKMAHRRPAWYYIEVENV